LSARIFVREQLQKFRVTNAPQLSVMRAFLSKARHGRLDELLQMLDARMVSVDAVDEYGNTVLIVAAQNNLKKIVKVRVPCSFSPPSPLLRISHQSQAVLRRGAYVAPCSHSRLSLSLSPKLSQLFFAATSTIKTAWVKRVCTSPSVLATRNSASI
jgi:hypothetical protein